MRAVRVFGFFVSVIVTGCGGGGGGEGTSSTPVATAPAPAPTEPIASPIESAALQTAVAPSYATDSYQAGAFRRLNEFRLSMGLGPLNQNMKIDDAAVNHQNYVRLNSSGADAHHEIAGNPGFTGINPLDRETFAGYPAVIAGEVIAFSNNLSKGEGMAIDNLINSVYHRNVMMNQSLTAVGMAAESQDSPLYIDMGATMFQRNAGDYVGVYPIDHQTGVWLTHGLESPNPFYQEIEATQENMCAKTSSPISIATENSTILTVTSYTVTEAGQATSLDARLITKATSAQDNTYLRSNVAFLIGKAPFKANTSYTVHFVGKATGSVTGTKNGMAIDKTWTFTTGSYTRGCEYVTKT